MILTVDPFEIVSSKYQGHNRSKDAVYLPFYLELY